MIRTAFIGRLLVPAAIVCLTPSTTVAGRLPDLVPESFPAAGTILSPVLKVRSKPWAGARISKTLPAFRPDLRPQIVYALRSTTTGGGRTWLQILVPGRPNGRRGWVRAADVDLKPVKTEIRIDRSRRRLELWRGTRRLLRSPVALGAPGAETPLGLFYVAARFLPDRPVLGVWAMETSAYSRISDWPGGGIVGIHGTNEPDSIGRYVSHGCVRLPNRVAARMRTLAPLGTTIRIVR